MVVAMTNGPMELSLKAATKSWSSYRETQGRKILSRSGRSP
jgi:hypothetical protein